MLNKIRKMNTYNYILLMIFVTGRIFHKVRKINTNVKAGREIVFAK